MASPTITLTARLQDFCGNNAGTTGNPAKLRIALVGYGAALPRIAGTSVLAQVGPWYYSDTGTGISLTLYGNDVITPLGVTYYDIAVIDGDGNMVQCAGYQFSGTETVDLSNATPFNPPPYPAYAVPLEYVAVTPQPPQAANAVYTAPGPIVMVFYNNQPQAKGVNWFPVGTSVTQFTLNFATYSGETVYVLCLT